MGFLVPWAGDPKRKQGLLGLGSLTFPRGARRGSHRCAGGQTTADPLGMRAPGKAGAGRGQREPTAVSMSSRLGTVATFKKQGPGEMGVRTRWAKAGRAVMG